MIKDKVFFSSRLCDKMAIVVEEIPEECEDGKVYFDGMTLIDGVEEIEDDIQQVYSYTKDGWMVNMENYYLCGDTTSLRKALDKLMNHEEYEQYLMRQNAPFEDRVRLFFEEQEEGLIESYTINEDGSVDVVGDVYIGATDLVDGHLPFKFGKIDGRFDAEDCGLTSLWGCPDEVTGIFCVGYNDLRSLEGCPRKVGGFFCENNSLKSLEGCPVEVGSEFVVTANLLTSLKGCPAVVPGDSELCFSRNYQKSSLKLPQCAAREESVNTELCFSRNFQKLSLKLPQCAAREESVNTELCFSRNYQKLSLKLP